MGIRNRVKHVDLGEGDWIELKPVSADELVAMQKKAKAAAAKDDEDSASEEGFAMLAAVRARIVAWSDPDKPTPKNTAELPIEINQKLLHALIGDDDLPLTLGSPSTATSTE